MKPLTLATALLVSTSTIAFADQSNSNLSLPNETHNWSGLYVGGHIGAGGSNFKGSYDDDDYSNHGFMNDGGGPFNLEDNGVIGGVQLGYNWQSGKIVYGIEGSFSFVDWSDSLTNDAPIPESVAIDTKYIATLRARAGYAWNDALVYGTLGAAYANAEYSANDDARVRNPNKMGSVDLNNLGLVVGAGVEYALSGNWSVKAEGLYYSFNDRKGTYDLTNDKEEGNFIKFEDAWSVNFGVNYRF